MKLQKLFLLIIVLVCARSLVAMEAQSVILDYWHDRIYYLAESFEKIVGDSRSAACNEMMLFELQILRRAKLREAHLRKESKKKIHLRFFSEMDLHAILRKQCFDEYLFCGYGVFMYALTSHAHENSLEQFLVHRKVDLAKLTTVEQLRSVIIDLLKIEQLQLFNSIGDGDDVQFGPEYLLAWAAWCGSLDIVQHLVDTGANVVQYGYYAIEAVAASLLDDIEIVRNEKCKIIYYLINKGAQVTHNACALSQRNCPAGDQIVALLAKHAPLCVIM